MKNLQEFIEKIQTQFDWVKKESGQLIDSNGVKLSLKTEYNDLMGIQSVLYLSTPSGRCFASWGAETIEESNEMARFFNLIKHETMNWQDRQEENEYKMYKAVFYGK
jgi:hypothetical protein